jgi:hypothetical protein
MIHLTLHGYPHRTVQDLTRYDFLHILHCRQELFSLHLDYKSVRASADEDLMLQEWLITWLHERYLVK